MSNNTEIPRVQTQEIKIEITKLYGLHTACIKLEHATRENIRPLPEWKPFPPSRFIYAYFTFNSIYSFDWAKSLREKKAIKWTPKHLGGLNESNQFKELVRFYYATLDIEAPPAFLKTLREALALFGIPNPEEKLRRLSASNETKKTKQLREKLPSNFTMLIQQKRNLDSHQCALFDILSFIYAVRNNVFHGSKTKIQMDNAEQQTRLLIYTAILIASNSLLFSAVERKNIGWLAVPVSFGATIRK